jgi:hypothetical protein
MGIMGFGSLFRRSLAIVPMVRAVHQDWSFLGDLLLPEKASLKSSQRIARLDRLVFFESSAACLAH